MNQTPKPSTLRNLIVSLADGLRPPERLTVSEAAEKYRYVHNPGSYIGPWKNDTTPYMTEVMDTLDSRDFNACIFVGPAQTGKALALTTRIPTPTGWTTMGELRVGDQILSADGSPCKVVFATDVMNDHLCYRVAFDDGSEVIADADHKWQVDDAHKPGRPQILTTSTLAQTYRYGKNQRSRFAIATAKPLVLPERQLPIAPYILGCWLGDGHSRTARIYGHADDLPELIKNIQADGYPVESGLDGKLLGVARVDPCPRPPKPGEGSYGLLGSLRALGLLTNYGGRKHIPEAYLRASVEQRLALLQGLMDTDGTVAKNGSCSFDTTSYDLARGVHELLCSLGFKVGRSVRRTSCVYKGERRPGKTSYRISFVAYSDEPVFRLNRKLTRLKERSEGRPGYTGRRWITKIEPVRSEPVRCIQVDHPSRLFLCGESMIPTHNTDALLINWLLHTVVCSPADFIMYQTSQSVARDFSRRRIDRLHRHSQTVGEQLLKAGDSDNTYDKFYRSGMILTLSWPTINELSGRPVGKVALTDYDRMPQDIDGEGSPFDLAQKRTTTFGSFAMTLAESSPGFETTNPKWLPATKHEAPPCPGALALYNRGDRRRWYWQCPDCRDWFEPAFKLLTWDQDKDIARAAASVHMACPRCGVALKPEQQAELNRGGRWLKEGQSVDKNGVVHGEGRRSNVASFWLKGPAAAFTSWQSLVTKYLQAEAEFAATGSQEALKSTVNTDQGEPYIPRGLGSSRLPEDLKAKSQPLPEREVPSDVRCLLATVDVQANRFEVQVHGIRPGLDVVVVDRFAIQKSKRVDPDGERYWVKPGTYLEDWELLTEQVLMKDYPLSDGSGRRMQIKMVGCDSGGREGVTAKAYDYYRTLRKQGLNGRFMLLKGASLPSAPRVTVSYPDAKRKDRKAAARGEIPVLLINTDKVKDQLDHMLDRTEPRGGMVVLPDWLPDSFFVELTVEQKDVKGRWVNLKKLRNEAWDLLVYNLALVSYLGMENINWQKPPAWVAEWDTNALVSGETAERRFASAPKPRVDLSKIAADLA
jgi:phage terminase large subunit GpA-like protein